MQPMITAFIVVLASAASQTEPLSVRANLAPGPYYVGQGIDLNVVVGGAAEAPRVAPPGVAGAEVSDLGMVVRPLASDAIGDVVNEVNRYIFRFRIVPVRSGTLRIPAVAARLGDRSGASAPREIAARDVPAEGRTSAFLGGVGALELGAEARPATVRVGQPFEYRIRLAGPGAHGSTQRPALAGLGRTGLGLREESLPDELAANPPARVFRWRLRPTRAGEAVLPPVAVAHFDPKARTYFTGSTPGVRVRVVDVPSFDPATLDYAPPTTRGLAVAWLGPALAGASALGFAASALVWIRRRRAAWRRDPRRLARRIAEDLEQGRGSHDPARRITEGLADYLAAAAGRSPGALTPSEARRWVAQVAGDADLADQARRLIADCDRARFAGLAPSHRPETLAPATLAAAGSALFRRLGELPGPTFQMTDSGSHITSSGG
jgi:hypothetical protein